MAEKILDVKNLKISFKTDNGLVQAVRDVSFELHKGETLCIVGESGSGKSVTSKAIMGILSNNAVVENGSIMYQGENLLEVSEEEFHKIRGHKIGMIFQDPLSSLNPIVRIGKQITEATILNGNKLKKMYEEIISNEFIAYKNALTKRRIRLNKATEIYNRDVSEAKKNKNKEAIKSLKSNFIKEKKEINQELKESLPELKKALLAKKSEAKAQVRAYKNKVNQEHKEAMALLRQELKDKQARYFDNFGPLTAKLFADQLFKVKNFFLKLFKQDKKPVYQNLLTDKKAKDEKFAADFATRLDIIDRIYKENEHHIDQLKITKAEAKRRALEIMKEVGIPLPEKRFRQYPFEFSGGMRQRIVIAIALTATPEILICDEPTTALDVTIQAQILELIKKIQAERNIACIFITHDLGVVANMADRVAVMYAGKIVEYGTADEIFFNPQHPYTWALLASIPDIDSKERLDAIPGTPPNMIYPPKGDAFALRSKYAMKIDFEHQPPFFKVSDTHYAATWLLHPDAPKVEKPKIVSERIRIALEAEKKRKLAEEVASNE